MGFSQVSFFLTFVSIPDFLWLSTDTFTPEQLSTASLYFLEPGRGSTPLQITKSVRDRAMLLLTTTMAFRGDNLRNIGWSDLYMRDILLSEVGPEAKVPVRLLFLML